MEEQNWDVVIVGGGVAGSLTAYKLAQQGAKVLLLEAGPRVNREETVTLFRDAAKKNFQVCYPEVDYAPQPPGEDPASFYDNVGPVKYSNYYLRRVGGTTWHWAGMAWRLLPNDFKIKSLYGVGRDWPLEYNDLETYYCDAEKELGVAGNSDDDLGSPRSKPYPMPEMPFTYMEKVFQPYLEKLGMKHVSSPCARNTMTYDDRPECCGNNNCMPICPIGAQYSGDVHATKAEKAGAMLKPESVAYFVEVDNDKNVTAVKYKDPSGKEYTATGKIFVLAAHGIETPKLMLMSKSDNAPEGLANSSDQVGRNLMDNPQVFTNFITAEPIFPGRGPQVVSSIVSFRDGEFRKESASLKLNFGNMVDVQGITEKLISQGYFGKELEDKLKYTVTRTGSMDSFVEQLADPQNRVMLSDRKDKLGNPYPKVYYSIDDYTKRGGEHAKKIFEQIGNALGVMEQSYDISYAYNNHIYGTTIAGNDPKDSVVDSDGRTYDHKNLFIVGSSIFPTSSSVNPTLTIEAVSLRTVDKILEQLKAT